MSRSSAAMSASPGRCCCTLRRGNRWTVKDNIAQANEEVARRLTLGEPVLVDIAPAAEVIPGMRDRIITHSGPPIEWSRMCGAQQGALIGMVLYEGWAEHAGGCTQLARAGRDPSGAQSSPWRRRPDGGHDLALRAGVGRREPRLRQPGLLPPGGGPRSSSATTVDEALEGLRRWRDVWAPTLREALHHIGGLALDPIIIQALQMGDELHNRHSASSSLFANQMAVAISKADIPRDRALPTLQIPRRTQPAVPGPGHGVRQGDRRSGARRGVQQPGRRHVQERHRVRDPGVGPGGEWFVAPAPAVEGLYLPGFSAADAGLDMGDSAITETVGWGAFTLAARRDPAAGRRDAR